MRVLLLVNTTASSVTARKRVVIRKALSADHDVTVAETGRRGHATRLARAAAVEGVDVVAVLAGDGTLNEAADGLAGTETALAPLPGGSTNVYARTLGIPDDAIEATGTLLASLEARSFERIGLGRVDGRHFLFHLGLAFDATVIRQVERRGEMKRYAAHPLFVLAAVDTWFRHFDRSAPRLAIHLDDGELVDDVYFAIVSKTTPYTYLGHRPIHVAPEAGLHSRLSLTAFRSLDVLTLVGGAASGMLSGRFLRRRSGVVHRPDLSGLRVESRAPFPYQVDGDDMGDAGELSVRYVPDALTLVTP